MLDHPAPTSWGTIQRMCQSFLYSESHSHAIPSARNFGKGTIAQREEISKVRSTVKDDQFSINLKTSLAILVSLENLIENYSIPVSSLHRLSINPCSKCPILCSCSCMEPLTVYLTSQAPDLLESTSHETIVFSLKPHCSKFRLTLWLYLMTIEISLFTWN